jgi:hypothetical protein
MHEMVMGEDTVMNSSATATTSSSSTINPGSNISVDGLIDRLLAGIPFLSLPLIPMLAVRESRPGKPVHLDETEIRFLCERSREVFLGQPILLELEAPIKVCGTLQSFIYSRTCVW